MSTCISRHGEFGSHEPDADYTCTLCGVLDEDAIITELRELREERDALRVGAELIATDTRPLSGRYVRELVRDLLDRTSITGE